MTAQALILSGQDPRAEFRRWCLAAAIIVAVHVGLAASYLLLPKTPPPGAPLSPAVIIELAPLPVTPSSESDQAGPQLSEEVQPPPEILPQVEPQVEPVPKIEVPAEIVLPKEEPKPVERQPEAKPEITKPDTKVERKPMSHRSESAPRSNKRTAERPAAPLPGASHAAMADWRSQVVARLQSVKRYPSGADGAGSVLLSFTVARGGNVVAHGVVRGSGNSAFDQEAVAMVNRASPFPPVPAGETVPVHLTVPINFSRR
jgi:protein TonB